MFIVDGALLIYLHILISYAHFPELIFYKSSEVHMRFLIGAKIHKTRWKLHGNLLSYFKIFKGYTRAYECFDVLWFSPELFHLVNHFNANICRSSSPTCMYCTYYSIYTVTK